jgi:hypothetical protein
MISDEFVLRVERLRDSLEDLRSELRTRYKSSERQVTSKDVRDTASRLAETWMVEVAGRADVGEALGSEVLADLNVQFQRLLTNSDKATFRKKYDAVLKAVLTDFRGRVVIPLKQARARDSNGAPPPKEPVVSPDPSVVFIGQSFASADVAVNGLVGRMVEALGLTVLTGEKPSADLISEKVKKRIDEAQVFLGLFTRRDKIARKQEWATSAWIIDEKAYALAKKKKLILIKEQGVVSVGGLQGDYEYLEFTRENVGDLLVRLVQLLGMRR